MKLKLPIMSYTLWHVQLYNRPLKYFYIFETLLVGYYRVSNEKDNRNTM